MYSHVIATRTVHISFHTLYLRRDGLLGDFGDASICIQRPYQLSYKWNFHELEIVDDAQKQMTQQERSMNQDTYLCEKQTLN